MAERHGNWARWLVPAIYAGCIMAFVADLRSANDLAFGVFYAPLIVTAVFHRDKRAVWVLTGIACVMVVIGSFLPDIAEDVTALVENRVLSILALLSTAVFVWHARIVQEQLSEQTNRVAAAERIKTEVLTNLSQEIRAPLYAMIGVLELVAADSRPDQKAALGMVRSSGRRLVTTVDNLVDLTQLEDRSVPAEPFDLGQLLRQTGEARRPDAAARQISLIIAIPPGHDTIADANPWAVRRILENKIEDAITYTPPGGRIEVSTVAEWDHVSAVIVTTGKWPAGAMQATSGADNMPLNPSIMGLVLSQRLAGAMGARLVFSDGSDEGTTIQLRLRAATRPDAGDT